MAFLLYLALCTGLTAIVGWPIAHVLLPRSLRRYSLVAAPAFGFAYVVAIGFLCYRLNLGGAQTYAWFMAVPPLVGLVALLAITRLKMLLEQDWVPLLIYLPTLALLSQFYLLPDGRMLSLSIGNLDIVELTSEARFLLEFPRNTTVGVFGQSNEFQLILDTFWAGPALFCAFHSAILAIEPYKIQSLVMCVIAAQGAPFVWLIARRGLDMRPEIAIGAALLYAANPIIAYTLWQSFGAQTLSMSVLLLCVAMFMSAMQEEDVWKGRLRYAPALVLMFSCLLINYHFFLLIAVALLGAYLLVLAATRRSFTALLTGSVLLAVSLVATMLLNPFKVIALFSNLSGLLTGDNGWFIPWLSPEVQLGIDTWSTTFANSAHLLLRRGVAVLVGITFLALLIQLVRQRNAERIAFVFGLAAVTFLVGLYFAFDGSQRNILGGYRSYKITASFVAFTLLSLALAFSGEDWTKSIGVRAIAGIAFVGLLGASLLGQRQFVHWARTTEWGYVMPADFPDIQKLEAMPGSGFNFKDTPANFDLFWAHYFTMRKQQVFARFPYGRPVHAFDQPYTVAPIMERPAAPGTGTDIFFYSAGKSTAQRVNSRFELYAANDAPAITLSPGKGWWPKEATHRWTGETGRTTTVLVDNRGPEIRVKLSGLHGELRPDDAVEAALGDTPIPSNSTSTTLVTEAFTLPAGPSEIRLTTKLEPQQAPAPDPRKVGVMWRELRLEPAG